MFSWSLLIGGLVYVIVGEIFNRMIANYIWELTDKVLDTFGDERYARMLWYTLSLKDTTFNRFIVNVLFTVFWPVACIVSILKAESNYDRIMHRNAFRRKAP